MKRSISASPTPPKGSSPVDKMGGKCVGSLASRSARNLFLMAVILSESTGITTSVNLCFAISLPPVMICSNGLFARRNIRSKSRHAVGTTCSLGGEKPGGGGC